MHVNEGHLQGSLPCLYLTEKVVAVLKRVVHDAQDGREVCGILGGGILKNNMMIATVVNDLSNISELSGCFAIAVDEILRSQSTIEDSGLLSLAIYHSHPSGSTRPSPRDTKLPQITGLLSLILADDGGKLLMECYSDVEGKLTSIRVALLTQ